MNRKRCMLVGMIILAVLVLLYTAQVMAQEPDFDFFVFLPMVMGGTSTGPWPTPTNTLVPPETATPTPFPTPSVTAAPVNTQTPIPLITPTPTLPPTWTPTPVPLPLLNGDFENGLDGSWLEYFDPRVHFYPTIVTTYFQWFGLTSYPGYGSWFARLGGYDADPSNTGEWETTTAIEQEVTIPTGGTLHLPVDLCFEYLIYSEDYWDNDEDTFTVSLDGYTIATWMIIGSISDTYLTDWHVVCYDLDAWRGQTVLLRFETVNNFIWFSYVMLDNVELRVQGTVVVPTYTPAAP